MATFSDCPGKKHREGELLVFGRMEQEPVAKHEHLALLQQGTSVWNEWRKRNSDIRPELRGANLLGADLGGADLRGADLFGQPLSGQT
jgi:hypothetical protein